MADLEKNNNDLPNVAIVGAGPAGLVLARLLQLGCIPVTIYEAEDAANTETQLDTLELTKLGGQEALRQCDLLEQYKAKVRMDGDAMRVTDKNMKEWLTLPSSRDKSWFAQGKPEIDRGALRQILIDSLVPGTIKYGHSVDYVDLELRIITFQDGSEVGPFDLIVGADGAWSKTRAALTDTRPYFTGIGGFTGSIPDPLRDVPGISKLVNGGSWFNFSDSSHVVAQQTSDGCIRVTVWRVMSEDWLQTADYDVNDGEEVKDAMLKTYSDWSPEVRSLLGAIDPSTTAPKNLYMMPVEFEWAHANGVTLIGDAAHLMTPFSGASVNTSLEDAMELASAITQARTDFEELHGNIHEFEERMFERAQVHARRSKDMMDLMLFTENAPTATIERWIIRTMSDKLDPLALLFLRLLLFVVYFFKRHSSG